MTAACQSLTTGIDCHCENYVCMPLQYLQTGSGLDIPQSDGAIITTTCQPLTARIERGSFAVAEGKRANTALMPA
jgi:hypothetical protein